jgi:hypothetical protein
MPSDNMAELPVTNAATNLIAAMARFANSALYMATLEEGGESGVGALVTGME